MEGEIEAIWVSGLARGKRVGCMTENIHRSGGEEERTPFCTPKKGRSKGLPGRDDVPAGWEDGITTWAFDWGRRPLEGTVS